jgi:hypothetical protein
MQKWTTWLGVPLAGVLLVLLAQWGSPRSPPRGEASRGPQPARSQRRAWPGKPPYVLEVIGLGVSLDKHRQGKLWDALQKGTPSTIREMDPKKYPYRPRQARLRRRRRASALENGIRGLPMYWPPPSTPLEPSQTPSAPFRHGPVIGSWPAPTATAWG